MAYVSLIAALLLAFTFVWAAVAKLRSQELTSNNFQGLGLPWPHLVAKAVPVSEAIIATLLLALPRVGAAAALVLLAVFSVFLAVKIADGTTAACACFGRVSAPPLSYRDLIRNAGLAVLAGLVWLGG